MDTSQVTQSHKHPNYLGVFWVLAALTAVEVAVTYLPVPRIPVLVPLALLKAALVALFYMHLKYDRRIFSVIFLMGLLMAVVLMFALIVLFAPPLLDAPVK